MLKVNNKPVIRNIAAKSYKSNSERNRIAVFAIMLTTILFTVIFTLGMGVVESMEYNNMRMAGGSSHGSLKYLTKEQYEKLSQHKLIKEVGENIVVGNAVNEEFLKRPAEVDYSDKTAAKIGFVEPETGRLPEAENEIVTDTITLNLLDVKHKVGETVHLDIDIGGSILSKDFILSGYYEGDGAFQIGIISVSKAFINKHLAGMGQDIERIKQGDYTGTIRADIMFKNSSDIEDNIVSIINESGYNTDKNDDNTIAYGVNWSYISTNLSNNGYAAVIIVLGSLLIVFTGYLIIYNIFQISVIRDIRFYGLLKTIGTTGKQIRTILVKQALRMCVYGIPFGLAAGFIIGKLLLPLIMENMFGGKSTVSLNPIIFIGSAAFAVFTVLLSCNRPAKTAARISPVEAVKFSGVDSGYTKKVKHSSNGAKLHRMAFSNLGRNRKRTVISVISMSLSLVLMNSVFMLAGSFDMDKFVQKFIDVDFQIAHASYFNYEYMRTGNETSTTFVDAVKSQPGFENGGGIYTSDTSLRAEYFGDINYSGSDMHFDETNGLFTRIYAMDNFTLGNLDIVKGNFDLEKFRTGNYVLLGLKADDNGNIYYDEALYKVGEKVKLKVLEDIIYNNKEIEKTAEELNTDNVIGGNFTQIYSESKEYEVMGYYRMGHTNTSRSYGDMVTFALPDNELAKYGTLKLMTYLFNVQDGSDEQMEQFVKNYTEHAEPTMNYCSRENYKNEFVQFRTMLLTVGGTLCFIIGLIGLLNFINSINTSILARRREFAMLQSIGMTGKQLQKMLVTEGFFYAALTIISSFIITAAFSVTVLKGISDIMWFLSYDFNIISLLIAYPFLLITAVVIPYSAFKGIGNISAVEQLRTED